MGICRRKTLPCTSCDHFEGHVEHAFCLGRRLKDIFHDFKGQFVSASNTHLNQSRKATVRMREMLWKWHYNDNVWNKSAKRSGMARFGVICSLAFFFFFFSCFFSMDPSVVWLAGPGLIENRNDAIVKLGDHWQGNVLQCLTSYKSLKPKNCFLVDHRYRVSARDS